MVQSYKSCALCASNFSPVYYVVVEGYVTTITKKSFAGGVQNGFGTNALFNVPRAVSVTTDSKVYVADSTNNLVRLVDLAGLRFKSLVFTLIPAITRLLFQVNAQLANT